MTAGFVHLRYCPLAHCFTSQSPRSPGPVTFDGRVPHENRLLPSPLSLAIATFIRCTAFGLAEIFPATMFVAASRPVLASVNRFAKDDDEQESLCWEFVV